MLGEKPHGHAERNKCTQFSRCLCLGAIHVTEAVWTPKMSPTTDKYQLSFSICSPRRQGHRKPGSWLFNTYLCRAESPPTYSFTHPPCHMLTRTDLRRARKIFHFVKLQRLQGLPVIAASIFLNIFFYLNKYKPMQDFLLFCNESLSCVLSLSPLLL